MKHSLMLFAAMLLIGCSTQKEAVDGDHAFTHVSVLTMQSDQLLTDHTVVVEGGRIMRVAPSASLMLSDRTKVIDGHGKVLMPGLADMHIHLSQDQKPEKLSQFLAFGVTQVRVTWGAPFMVLWRDGIRRGEMIGPDLYLSGPIIDGDPPIWPGSLGLQSPDEVPAMVQDHLDQGYDFVKIYNRIPLDIFDAVALEAKRRGIPFDGHVPRAVPIEHALVSGMRNFEHVYRYRDAATREGLPTKGEALSELLLKLHRGEMEYSDWIDPDKLAALAQATRMNDVWNVPTLIVNRGMDANRSERAALLDSPMMKYVHKENRSFWNPDNDFRLRDKSDEQLDVRKLHTRSFKQVVAALDKADAKIMAGSDTYNPFTFEGYSLLEEVEQLAATGMGNYRSLQAATTTPGEFLKDVDTFGSIAEGMRADMILLHGNPVEDLKHLYTRSGVMVRGQWLPQERLQEMLDAIAAQYAQELEEGQSSSE